MTAPNQQDRDDLATDRPLSPKSFKILTPRQEITNLEVRRAENLPVMYTNCLGMKFVPVPVTTVRFCVYETRIRDFEVFVKETGYDATGDMKSLRSDGWKERGDSWRSPGFLQTRDHPVCGVSWEDAKAFCAWISKKEGRVYRLPTDLEWSKAVGLAQEQGTTPEDRSSSIPGVYPWGPSWPPFVDGRPAGNYGGEEARDGDWPDNFGVIAGYRDGFPRTSPAGSFSPNHHGLFDLSGNVWEWCEDRYKPDEVYRVMRGGSWVDGAPRAMISHGPGHLVSARRIMGNPRLRNAYTGFRLVLEGGVAGR